MRLARCGHLSLRRPGLPLLGACGIAVALASVACGDEAATQPPPAGTGGSAGRGGVGGQAGRAGAAGAAGKGPIAGGSGANVAGSSGANAGGSASGSSGSGGSNAGGGGSSAGTGGIGGTGAAGKSGSSAGGGSSGSNAGGVSGAGAAGNGGSNTGGSSGSNAGGSGGSNAGGSSGSNAGGSGGSNAGGSSGANAGGSSGSSAGGSAGAGGGAPIGPTFYVASGGDDARSCAEAKNAATPKKTIASALACLTPGDTLVLRDGKLEGAANALTGVPNGAPGKPITIMAEHDGGTIVTGGIDLVHTNAHLVIAGLRFHDASVKTIVGQHIAFFRNEFKGGCPSGNCTNTTVGTNDHDDTADILLEDNWWHGSGGRYNVLVYNAKRVVVRRGVIRHDGGWTDTKGDPEAGINFYNSSDCSAQNLLVLDNDLPYETWQGAFYSVYNNGSPGANANNSWYGNVALKSPVGGGFRLDGNGPITNAVVEDMVLWDAEYAAAMGSGSCKITVSIDRVTAGNSQPKGAGAGFVQYASSFAGTVQNVIVTGTKRDSDGVGLTYFDTFDNQNTSNGTGRVTSSPFLGGLKHLTRIEAGSTLATAGKQGGQIGARIELRRGKSGSFHGEAGWKDETPEPLWPYPNQTRIQRELCTDAGITRGFCAKSNVTDYVLGYLGNPNPYP